MLRSNDKRSNSILLSMHVVLVCNFSLMAEWSEHVRHIYEHPLFYLEGQVGWEPLTHADGHRMVPGSWLCELQVHILHRLVAWSSLILFVRLGLPTAISKGLWKYKLLQQSFISKKSLVPEYVEHRITFLFRGVIVFNKKKQLKYSSVRLKSISYLCILKI